MTEERAALTVLLVRHGEQLREGHDGSLSKNGIRQASHLPDAVAIGPHDRVVSSTLRRAVETAAQLGGTRREADLDEFRFGSSWSWTASDCRDDQALWQPDHRVGNGESLAEFERRARAALQREIHQRPRGRLVLVTHSGVIDALLRWAFGCGVESPWVAEACVAHASITELKHWPTGVHDNGAPRHTELIRVNDVAHLPADLVTGL